MFANQTSRHSIAATRVAEAHARQMFLYYFLRALLEAPGVLADSERRVVHAAAVEEMRFMLWVREKLRDAGCREIIF